LRVIFSSAAIEESDKDKPGMILDYDKDGNMVGIRFWHLYSAAARHLGKIVSVRGLEYSLLC
jgi:uncharacterized protein YuzE